MKPDVFVEIKELELRAATMREAIKVLLLLLAKQLELPLEGTLLELIGREIGYLKEIEALLQANLPGKVKA